MHELRSVKIHLNYILRNARLHVLRVKNDGFSDFFRFFVQTFPLTVHILKSIVIIVQHN